jgi:hypothetical protein
MKPIKFKCPSCGKTITIEEGENGFEMTIDKSGKENNKGSDLEEFFRKLEDGE